MYKPKGRGKRLRPIYKRMNKEKLYKQVKELVLQHNSEKAIFAEDIAKKLQVKTHKVKHAFMKLNQEGLISQAHNATPHDCIRATNIIDWGTDWSWMATRYYRRKK
jgi:predicted transcriptional regulator